MDDDDADESGMDRKERALFYEIEINFQSGISQTKTTKLFTFTYYFPCFQRLWNPLLPHTLTVSNYSHPIPHLQIYIGILQANILESKGASPGFYSTKVSTQYKSFH